MPWQFLPRLVHQSAQVSRGEIHEYTKLLAESREQAIDRMVAIATQRGANAVVNVRFSTAYVMSNAAEILAFGDAVVLEASRD